MTILRAIENSSRDEKQFKAEKRTLKCAAQLQRASKKKKWGTLKKNHKIQ